MMATSWVFTSTSGGASLGGGKGAAVDALAEPADAVSAGALASELGV